MEITVGNPFAICIVSQTTCTDSFRENEPSFVIRDARYRLKESDHDVLLARFSTNVRGFQYIVCSNRFNRLLVPERLLHLLTHWNLNKQ